MSVAKVAASDQESVSEELEPASCSGVSLTAAVLTHVGQPEDSMDDGATTTTVASQLVGRDEKSEGGKKEAPRVDDGEGGVRRGDVESNSKLPPLRAMKRKMKQSPAKKRESEDDIRELLDNIPEIAKEFDVISKIGEGTFSSVYMASVKGVPQEKFAIKHLIPTSTPSRIENELRFLQMLGGRDHVMSVCCCLRHRDHIALVMPYFKHDRFIEYLPEMGVSEARCYMKALFLALRNIHSHRIIHRDIKPSNFLYNRTTKQFQLVDFGLAHLESQKQSHKTQKDQSKSRPHKRSSSFHPLHFSTPTIAITRLTKTSTAASSTSTASTTSTSVTGITKINGIIAPPQTYQRQLHHRATGRVAVSNYSKPSTAMGIGSAKVKPLGTGLVRGKDGERGDVGRFSSATIGAARGRRDSDEVIRLCPMQHKVTEVCSACLARSQQTAPRAGTPGFRAPEVLLKYPHQTTAVDIWSAGVIFLCILSGRYPFFKAHDDMSALAQIVSLMGSKATADAAKNFGKSLVCEPEVVPVMDLKTLCSTLRTNSSSSSLSLRTRQSSSKRGAMEALPAPPKRTKHLGDRENELIPSINPALLIPSRSVRRSPRKQLSRDGLIGGGSSDCNASSRCESMDASRSDSDSWNQIPDSAFDLLYKCLDLNPATRISAELALQHSFIVDNR